MNHARTFLRLHQLAQKAGVEIKFKDKSKTMARLAKVLFFKRNFLTETVTAWNGAIYFPSPAWCKTNPETAWRELAHALVHVNDMHQRTIPFYSLLYLFPQCLSLLAFGAVRHPWMAVFLLALLPWPAPFRKHFEMRACAMTLATELWAGTPVDTCPSWLLDRFIGSHYYWCWPFRKQVEKEAIEWVAKAKAKKLGLFLPHTSDVKFSIRIEGVLR